MRNIGSSHKLINLSGNSTNGRKRLTKVQQALESQTEPAVRTSARDDQSHKGPRIYNIIWHDVRESLFCSTKIGTGLNLFENAV